MKITSVDVIALDPTKLPMSQPVLCRINTDEGLYGYGEAGATFITGSMACFHMIKDFAKLIIGMDPLANDVIWEKLYQTTFWGNGGGAIVMSAISAIDIALWDIKGKYCNLPLYQLLGGKHRSSLRAYASQLQFGWNEGKITAKGTRDEYEEVSRRAVSEGYTAIKVDILKFDRDKKNLPHEKAAGYLTKDTVKLIEERLSAVRKGAGSDTDIIVECHGRTDGNTAVQFAKLAQKYDIMMLEEPGALQNPALMKHIADNCEIPLASGERTYSRWGFMPFIANRSLSLLQPDLGSCGGITEAKKIAAIAQIYDIGIQAHVCCSPVSIAAALHFEASIPNFIIHEHHTVNTMDACTDFGVHDYQPKSGYIEVPELPGIGQELSEKALQTALIETVN